MNAAMKFEGNAAAKFAPEVVLEVKEPQVFFRDNKLIHGDSYSIDKLVIPDEAVFDIANAEDMHSLFYNGEYSSMLFPEGFGAKAIDMEYMFFRCKNLEELILPKGFGQNALSLNAFLMMDSGSKLKKLVLPEGFGQKATILKDCFSYLSVLESLRLPEGFGQNATQLYRCFCRCSSLTSLTLPESFGKVATYMRTCFYRMTSLVSLYLPDGFGRASTDNEVCFKDCPALTTITGNPNFKVSIDFSFSPLLTVDSLMVIINGLQTVTKAQTLTLGETNLAKLTEEQKAVAINKGWTLA